MSLQGVKDKGHATYRLQYMYYQTATGLTVWVGVIDFRLVYLLVTVTFNDIAIICIYMTAYIDVQAD